MSDPLTALGALGLASNLISVIQFSYDIVSEGNRIYRDADGILTHNKATEEVAKDLSDLTEALKSKQDEWQTAHGQIPLDADDTRIRNICDRCIEVSLELQIQLNKLKAKEGRGKRLRSYKQALMSVWHKDGIEDIAKRLERYQSELDTRVLVDLRQKLQDAEGQNTEQFNILDQRTKAVLDHHGSFDTKLEHHTEILAQIREGQLKAQEMLQVVVRNARSPSPGPPTYAQATIVPSDSTDTPEEPPLHQASREGDTVKLRQLLRNAAVDVSARDEYGYTPLHVAANAEIAKHLLRDKRTDIGAEDYEGRSALHTAVLKRRLDVIKVLLENSVDTEWKDDGGKTAISYAQDCPAAWFMLRYGADIEARATMPSNNTGLLHVAWLGDLESTRFYLDQGAAVNARNNLGETALTESARHGDVQIVELLLQHGADMEIGADPGREWTPLMQAIRDGREDAARVLINHGAKRDHKLASGNNCLAEACWRKHFGIAKALVEAGERINHRDLLQATPLFKAAGEGDAEFVRWAIAKGADLEAKNNKKATPLYEAISRGNSEIVTILLEAGASHMIKVPPGNYSPLGLAALRGRNKSAKVLLQHGADPNAKGHCDNTPLVEACCGGHPKLLKHLIAAGGDIEASNGSGYTPLHAAVHRGEDECVRVLVEAGADLESRPINQENQERFATPLIRAIRWKRYPTAIKLVQLGADVNAIDSKGNTALIEAVRNQQTDVVSTLLKAGADVNAAEVMGATALHAAARRGDEAIVRMLLDAGANARVRSSLGRTPWITAVHTGNDRVLKSLLGPNREEDEKLRALIRDKTPGEVAKYMNETFK
ncbi:hypothetical protein Q7P37_001612 [Cladosporium fusiforme]